MAQRFMNLTKWGQIEPGSMAVFSHDRPRMVKLQVNTAAETALYIDTGGVEQFLALVKGRDEIEFGVDGAFNLTHDSEREVYIYTADGDDVSFEVIDAESFTEIVERRPRNEEFDAMMYTVMQNVERRMAQQQAELERRVADRPADGPAVIVAPAVAPAGDPVQPGSTDRQATPVAPVSEAGDADDEPKPES
ncbi:hypothetical protein [Flyfo microvirus Tbat2_112]|nr:hypothetical protein [Flyfo microvirus Tbat2_112]